MIIVVSVWESGSTRYGGIGAEAEPLLRPFYHTEIKTVSKSYQNRIKIGRAVERLAIAAGNGR
jgi:hypothetical protein